MLLHIGFGNMVAADEIVAILDYKVKAVQRIAHSIKEEKPRNLINLTRGRKALTFLVLKGDRYMITFLPLKQVINRYMIVMGQPAEDENEKG